MVTVLKKLFAALSKEKQENNGTHYRDTYYNDEILSPHQLRQNFRI